MYGAFEVGLVWGKNLADHRVDTGRLCGLVDAPRFEHDGSDTAVDLAPPEAENTLLETEGGLYFHSFHVCPWQNLSSSRCPRDR